MRSLRVPLALLLVLLLPACGRRPEAAKVPGPVKASLEVLGRPFDAAIIHPTPPRYAPGASAPAEPLREFRVVIHTLEDVWPGTLRMAGTITDAETGERLPADVAWLHSSNPTRGAVVESSGRFETSLREVDGATLRVRMRGYRTLEIDVGRFAGMARRRSTP